MCSFFFHYFFNCFTLDSFHVSKKLINLILYLSFFSMMWSFIFNCNLSGEVFLCAEGGWEKIQLISK